MELRQYQIILVNLNPTVGSGIRKTRPCVIISPDEMNKYLKTAVVAPLTSTSKAYPTRIEILHHEKRGWIVLDQIRTIDRSRIIKVTGKLAEREISLLKHVLHETYVA